jgi:hypothetical protein
MLSPSPQVSSLLATFQQFYHGLLSCWFVDRVLWPADIPIHRVPMR